ncbi:flippase [Mitsuokella multacida]|uniref:flippase n=1 Tax=Mitsuokella multacida TaxID=52226 RepID=UPI001F173D9C|nr:flippase [Mitsuokella multacida]MCF2583984.1 flippase [Mitsuokella multacida]
MKITFTKLTENITSLISLKGAEYILNFILFPYLVRILGVERFGAIVFMQGLVQYSIILVDYGFNLTGPRDIARSADKDSVARVFSNIMTSKVLIFIVVTVFSFLLIRLFHMLLGNQFDECLYWAVYLLVLGNVFFPVWFFQGIQQMRYITIFNIIARSITVVLVFSFVRTPNDYLLAALFQSATLLLAGIFSMVILKKNFSYIFVYPNIIGIKKTMIDGWHIFLSTIAINVYTTTNTVILGCLTNNTVVGYFSTANKLIDCVKGVMFTLNQAVYPYVSSIIKKEGNNHAIKFIKKYLLYYSGASFVGGALLAIFSSFIIKILFGDGYDESIHILQLMACLPFIISISNVFGIQIMLNFGYQKAFSRILVSAALIDFFLVIPLAKILHGYGIAITMILVESFVTICTIKCVLKSGLVRF